MSERLLLVHYARPVGDQVTREVVVALARQEDRILMVCQQAADDLEPTWVLPAGAVEAAETLEAALDRELREETGLRIKCKPRSALTVSGPDGWTAHTFACDVAGTIAPDDPDGLVLSASWIRSYVGTPSGRTTRRSATGAGDRRAAERGEDRCLGR
jgi:ADP-ribose pyrophosphatase YjhB (NUDIX family)